MELDLRKKSDAIRFAHILALTAIEMAAKKKNPKHQSVNSKTPFKVIKIVDGDTFKISPGQIQIIKKERSLDPPVMILRKKKNQGIRKQKKN